jgi:hypothetical protein
MMLRKPHSFSAFSAAFGALLGASIAFGPSSARAEPVKGVVEMFTSQGCSSCPPADAVLAELAGEPGLLALSWHVDYWDYLGWKDTLGLPDATMRQRSYAAQFQSRSVYTPQAVVNGAAGMVGSKEAEVRAALSSVPFPALGVTLARQDQRIAITLAEADLRGAETLLELIYFAPRTDVVIERGENAGHTVTYINSVRGLSTLGLWTGEARVIEMPVAELETHGAEGCAVLVRTVLDSGAPGPIIAAAALR